MQSHRNMRRSTLALLACVSAAGLLTAQQPQANKQSNPLDALSSELGLSSQQKQEISKIHADIQKKREPLEQQLWSLHQQERKAMDQVLTAEQRARAPQLLKKEWDKELSAVAAKLGVNQEQTNRIEQIRNDYAKKFKALSGQNGADLSERFVQLRHELFGAIRHELTAKQQAQLPEVLRDEFAEWQNPATRRERLKTIGKELGLSAEQQKQLEQVHAKFAPTIEQKAGQVKQLWQTERDQVEKVLTPEQQTKLQNLREGKSSDKQNTSKPASN